jgi:hypothetical protein
MTLAGSVLWGLERPRRRCRRRGRALHPATDRPLSRPPGQVPRRDRARQGRVASLRDRLRRPVTLARAARAGVHAAPRGRPQPGRPGSEAYEPEYQPDQHFRSAAGRSDGGTLGRIAVGDHIPSVGPV